MSAPSCSEVSRRFGLENSARCITKEWVKSNNRLFAPVAGNMASKMLFEALMMRLFKSHRILIPDVPPARRDVDQDLVVAGIGVFCATILIGALLFVFLGA